SEGVTHRGHRRGIDAAHGAVAADVGVDEVGDAALVHGPGQLGRVDGGVLQPAPDRDLHAARVDGARHAVRSIAFDHRCHDVGAPDSQGTDDDPVHDVEPALGVLHAAHPATDLDAGFDGAGDGCDDSGVGSAFEGGVEVDEVQP